MRLRVLITSGPTQEPLDPVRYLSNRSTGTLGFYLEEAFRAAGCRVTHVRCPEEARTARDLQAVLNAKMPRHDVLVMTAAVCDARPVKISEGKIKKTRLTTLRLIKNPDILAGLGRRKRAGQFFVGFGVESSEILRNGFKKLRRKNLDVIVMQRVTKRISPFGKTSVAVWILTSDGAVERIRSISKRALARRVAGKCLLACLGAREGAEKT